MPRMIITIILLLFTINIVAQEEIKLIIRGDDMGSTHAANLACIEAYKNGIQRSVEVMVPTPWFEEAAMLLNQNKNLDVGSHIVLSKAGFAISYGLGQGATMVAAAWGVFIWKEFKGAPKETNLLIMMMFLCFMTGLGLIIMARLT